MAGFVPSSEQDLARAVPSSHRPNVFPRDALLGDEKVLFETRPAYGALITVPLIWTLFWALAFGAVEAPMLITPEGIVVFLIILLLFGAPLWVVLLVSRSEAFAITTQRVLRKRGSSFESAVWTRVGDVRMLPRSRTVVFEMAPPPPGAQPLDARSLRSGRIVWKRVPGAGAVSSFARSAQLYYGVKMRQREIRQQMVLQHAIDRIVCEYCGNDMRIDQLDPDRPKCGRCGAPVRVALT